MKQLVVFVAVLPLLACAGGMYLASEQVTDIAGAAGTVRLILYGGNYQDDIETLAILDLEGDAYEIRPVAPKFDYSLYAGLTMDKAVEEAKHFVGMHREHLGTWTLRVLGPDGRVIGYELRPVYKPFNYGTSNVLYVSYYLMEGGEVRVYVRLKPEVERLLKHRRGEEK